MDYNPFSLFGKKILVTGASTGIGRAIAVECSQMGATVYITARSKDGLQKTLGLMAAGEHMMFPADLTKEAELSVLADSLPELDGVVHNAGIGDRTLCKMIKESDLERVMSINFNAPVLLQRLLLKKKKIARDASVVFIASRAPFAPAIGNGLYSASKGALLAYAKVLGLELAPQKIRFNCICPAMVWTELVAKDAALTGADYTEAQKRYPLQRYGRPEDIAYLAVYLLSDASGWMTGSRIDITGGVNSL